MLSVLKNSQCCHISSENSLLFLWQCSTLKCQTFPTTVWLQCPCRTVAASRQCPPALAQTHKIQHAALFSATSSHSVCVNAERGQPVNTLTVSWKDSKGQGFRRLVKFSMLPIVTDIFNTKYNFLKSLSRWDASAAAVKSYIWSLCETITLS